MENINSPVMITALGFTRRMGAYPRRMEWNGRSYNFIDHGIIVRGRQGSTVTMSDGLRQFCLQNVGSSWTLLAVK